MDQTLAWNEAERTPYAMSLARTVRSYWLETKYEFIRMLRFPMFVVPTVGIPLIMFVFFGVVLGRVPHGPPMKSFLITCCIFGSLSPGLFGAGVSVAMERSANLLTLKRALPMPAGSYFLSRLVMGLIFSALVTGLLIVIGSFVGAGVSPAEAAVLLGLCALGVIPSCAIGLFIGMTASPLSAPMIINVSYFVMAALSGLWMPLEAMSSLMRTLAQIWPYYHLIKLIRAALGTGPAGGWPIHLGVLFAVSALFFVLAARQMRRNS